MLYSGHNSYLYPRLYPRPIQKVVAQASTDRKVWNQEFAAGLAFEAKNRADTAVDFASRWYECPDDAKAVSSTLAQPSP